MLIIEAQYNVGLLTDFSCIFVRQSLLIIKTFSAGSSAKCDSRLVPYPWLIFRTIQTDFHIC